MRALYLLIALLAAVGLRADGYKQNGVAELPLTGVVEFIRPGDRYFFMTDVAGSGTWRVEATEAEALRPIRSSGSRRGL